MTVELLEALATDLLENENLVCLGVIIYNGSLYNGSLHIRSSDLDSLTVSDEKHFAELYVSTLGIGEPLHKDFVASLNFKLLACNFYDCVHQTNFLMFGPGASALPAALYVLFGHKMDRKDSNYY